MSVNEKKRQEILNFLRRFAKDSGRSPSVREIGLAVGLRSTSSVYGYIRRMEKDGLIEHDPMKPRSVRPVSRKKSVPPPLCESDTPATLKIQCDFDLPPDVKVQSVIALLTDQEGNPLNPSQATHITQL